MKKKGNRFLVRAVSVLILALLLFIAFLPSLLSTNIGKKSFTHIINAKFSGKFTIEKLSLSWFGDQNIQGIQWKNQKKGVFIRCDQISSSTALWRLLLKNDLGEMKMHSPHMELDADLSPPSPFGYTEYEPASLSIQQAGLVPKLILKKRHYFGNIEVDGGTLLLFSKQKNLAAFQKVSAQFHLPEEHFPVGVALIGQTQQDQNIGKFEIKAEIHSFNFSKPHFDLSAKLVQFPIHGIDELFSFFDPSLKGLIYEGIGPTFDLDLDAKFHPENKELSLLAQSSHLHAEIHTESKHNVLALQTPGKLIFTITPTFAEKFFPKFSSLKNFGLINSPEIVLHINQLSLPSGFDFSKAAFHTQMVVSSAQLVELNTKESIQLDALSLSLTSEEMRKTLKLSSNISIQMDGLNSAMQIRGDFKNPFSDEIQGNCKIQVQDFPIKLLEEKIGHFVGTTLSGHCTIDLKDKMVDLKIKASTPSLKISEASFHIDDFVMLLEPIQVDFHPSNAPLQSPMKLSIEQLSFPKFSPEKMRLTCHFQIPHLQLYKQWDLNNLEGEILARSLEEVHFHLRSHEINMESLFSIQNNFKDFFLKKPLLLDYVLTEDKFHSLFPKNAKAPILLSPLKMHLTVDPFSLNQMRTKAAIGFDAFTFQYENQIKAISNIKASLAIDLPKESFEAAIKTENLDLHAEAKLIKWDQKIDFSKADMRFNLHMEDFSLQILDALLAKSYPLTPLLGPTLNLSLQAVCNPDVKTVAVTAKSHFLNLETSVDLKENLLEMNKPSKLDLTITEKGYQILDQLCTGQNESPFELQKPIQIQLSIKEMFCPLSHFKPDFWQIYLTADLQNEECSFLEKNSGQVFTLEKTLLAVDHTNSNTPFSFDIKSNISSKDSNSLKEGKVAIEAIFKEHFQNQKVQLKILKFPSTLLDIFARSFGRVDLPFSALFGETLNAQLHIDLKNFTGPISANLHSPNTRISFAGEIDNGILTLKERLYAQMALTPGLSTLFLKEINPFSISSIESVHPVTLEIDPKGFSLPLLQKEFQKVSLPHARIELGQIVCKNEGNLNQALALLKQNVSKSPHLHLWFTPIDFQVQNNICTVERTEILINNSLELCTFGQLDIAKEKVDMVLGLTAQCLKKAFGIGNLPPNYILQIPLKGPMDNVKLGTKKATSKLTALLLWQKSALAAGSLGGKGTGALLGDLIGKMATLPDNNAKSPSAKHPFPWEKGSKISKKEDKPIKKKKVKIKTSRRKPKPLKQLFKILT